MIATMRHVQHCNVNCLELDRSLAFYRDELGLAPLVRTHPEPQDGSGFGIDGPAQWDAWMLSDGRANPVIDLLEWKVPAPVGRPIDADGIGLAALRLEVPDLDGPSTTSDPDGTHLELRPGNAPRFTGVVVNVADVGASREWYERVLGLETAPETDVRTDGVALRVPGDEFIVELRPGRPGTTAALGANRLGIFRMAFLVTDAPASVAAIRGAGADCPDPVQLDMGPDIPIEGLWAVFFRDLDGACVELIQEPTPRVS